MYFRHTLSSISFSHPSCLSSVRIPNGVLSLLYLLCIFVVKFRIHKVRSYALVMGLGKPDPRAMSETIEYMEHNEQALSQVWFSLVRMIRLGRECHS